MALRKQYVLVSSDERENSQDSTTNFTVRLSSPIKDVVKLDLVDFILDYGVVRDGLPFLPSYFLIQSRYLGIDLVTASGVTGYWRIIPNTGVSNSTLIYSNSREDEYLRNPRNLQDIDIKLLLPDGTVANNGVKPLRLVLEVISLE
jgi:hypothetical protein